MNDQPSSQATNANPSATRPANALTPDDWEVLICDKTDDCDVLGFLQLCADRRFHECIQRKFREDAGLESRDAYWIHADAGGTPKMECERTAPDYCYYDKHVRLMGWSAHGNICGGFGPNVPDEEIEQALVVIFRRKVEEYPEAEHFCYFAREIGVGDAEKAAVYSLKHKKG